MSDRTSKSTAGPREALTGFALRSRLADLPGFKSARGHRALAYRAVFEDGLGALAWLAVAQGLARSRHLAFELTLAEKRLSLVLWDPAGPGATAETVAVAERLVPLASGLGVVPIPDAPSGRPALTRVRRRAASPARRRKNLPEEDE